MEAQEQRGGRWQEVAPLRNSFGRQSGVTTHRGKAGWEHVGESYKCCLDAIVTGVIIRCFEMMQ